MGRWVVSIIASAVQAGPGWEICSPYNVYSQWWRCVKQAKEEQPDDHSVKESTAIHSETQEFHPAYPAGKTWEIQEQNVHCKLYPCFLYLNVNNINSNS